MAQAARAVVIALRVLRLAFRSLQVQFDLFQYWKPVGKKKKRKDNIFIAPGSVYFSRQVRNVLLYESLFIPNPL